MNLQPSEAEAGFDIRIPPTADQVSLEKRIAEEWAPASRNMTFEVIYPTGCLSFSLFGNKFSSMRRKPFSCHSWKAMFAINVGAYGLLMIIWLWLRII